MFDWMVKSTHTLTRAALLALAVATPAAVLTAAGVVPAHAQSGPEGEVDLETFHRELSPHGKWFNHARWGEVWRPNVEENWRPYTRGHWAWTDDHGWYWVAEEEWGWAPFHYGRWVFDEDEEEWLWIPGYEWAPAWVQWRESEETVGWAPLPPDSILDGGALRLNQTYYDSPRFSKYWVFASPSVMFLPGLFRHIMPVSRHSTVWRSTRHVHHHHRFDRGRIYMPGVDHRRIERWSGRSVPLVSLRPVTSPRDYGWRRMDNQSVVPVYRPRVVSRPDVARPQRPTWGDRTGGDRWSSDRRPENRPVVVTPGSGGGRPDWQRDQPRREDASRGDGNRGDGNRGDGRRRDFGDRRWDQPRQQEAPVVINPASKPTFERQQPPSQDTRRPPPAPATTWQAKPQPQPQTQPPPTPTVQTKPPPPPPTPPTAASGGRGGSQGGGDRPQGERKRDGGDRPQGERKRDGGDRPQGDGERRRRDG